MNIIFPLSVVDGIMGGDLILCINSCMYASMGVHPPKPMKHSLNPPSFLVMTAIFKFFMSKFLMTFFVIDHYFQMSRFYSCKFTIIRGPPIYLPRSFEFPLFFKCPQFFRCYYNKFSSLLKSF